MDFFTVKTRAGKNHSIEVYPDFKVTRSKDLMVRGKSFYAIWDEDLGLWSTDEYDVQRLIDKEIDDYISNNESLKDADHLVVKRMSDFSSKSWIEFRNYVGHVSDNSHQLDEKIAFSNTEVTKKDYISHKLPYNMEEGSIEAYDELMRTLYSPEEREKIEWAVGSIINGDSKTIQKFIVLYGEAGTGKSTVLNIIQKLFQGYYTTFEAKQLVTSSNAFATEVFKSNPLVAIQHDGDLSRIEDNTKLNSIVSHEEMVINEKYKSSYPMRINCFLFMGTNKPVKITDAKSGIIRRLIDVKPTGLKLPIRKYNALYSQIDFELGAIAKHCLDVYLELGKNYYNSYRPVDMMFKTDVFFNFVEDSYFVFKRQEGVSLKQAYSIYKEYCDESGTENKLPMYRFREELKNYFEKFEDIHRDEEGKQIRSYYSGFLYQKFERKMMPEEKGKDLLPRLVLDYEESLFDKLYSEAPAQYANSDEVPYKKWADVETKLKDINTKKLHYVKVPENHIVIDFDLKEDGKKSLEKNLEAASKWPATYAEFSKSGCGIHLHYIYDGDPSELSRIYDKDIEIKVFRGKSSLRRKLTKCNNIPINHISSGLPKVEKKGGSMVNIESVQNEKVLRSLIEKNLKKEIHPNTTPSIDFIKKLLDDMYASGKSYDVRDLRPEILEFATNSSHQSARCIKTVLDMKFCSDNPDLDSGNIDHSKAIIFYDIEVFPNLFLVCWKYQGSGKPIQRMFNPSPKDIEFLMSNNLIGFNCRRYDNHLLYARYLGYSIEELYSVSQNIINGRKDAFFGEAYNLSYTDVYDFCATKQSLKKWEIELDIHHKELGLPWDKPVDEKLWNTVADYCDNDVIATEAVFDKNQADFQARKILAELSGLTVNDTTNSHTQKIIFGDERKPQDKFVYTDLSEMFPGYTFDAGKSYYRDELVGEGGYVYAEPGMYENVALLDVASMHPTSLEELNLFGPYTKNFSDIKKARIFIKHEDYISAGELFDGKLKKFLTDKTIANSLAYALKIAINSVYGLTSASFPNRCRDPRNIDNIVAKRGALFMIDLKNAVQEKGFIVAHIKTDSIKIPNATEEIISFVMDFGKKYGYTFEHEATYSKMCLVNDAVYIAKYRNLLEDGKNAGKWTATGAQFAEPYVFKKLFSKEPIEFNDYRQVRTVSTSLYLDMNEDLPDVTSYEKELEKIQKLKIDTDVSDLVKEIAKGHCYIFVGKAGAFVPIKPGYGGGILVREKDGKYYSANGSKGYRWLEAETVKALHKENEIDESYYISLVDAAVRDISQFGDFEWFVSDDHSLPWN